MTIAEKLQTIAENEPKVYEAGREKGYREGYTDATSGTAFEIDESTAYRKVVPSASEKLAQVLQLGGMSYKTKNLIPFPYLNTSAEISGVKFTVQDDGGIKVKGTASSSTTFRLANKNTLTLPTNIPITLSGGIAASANSGKITINLRRFDVDGKDMWFLDTEGNPSTGTLSTGETLNYISIYIAGGTTVDATVYPMLNEGSTALPYEPFFEGIRSAKVTELVSEGANKFNPNAEPRLFNDISLEVLSGNTWKLSTKRVSTNQYYYATSAYIPICGENAYFSATITPFGKVTKGILNVTLRDKNGTNLARSGLDGSGTKSNSLLISKTAYPTAEYIDVTCYATAGESCDIGDGVEYSNIMVSFDADVPYTPFVGTIATKPIPEALRNFLEQYGYRLGINETYHNYIDYGRKVFVPKVIEVTFDGSADENWSVGGNASQLMKINISVPAVNLAPCLANSLNGKTVGPNTLAEGEFDVMTNAIYIRKEAITNPNGTSGDVNKMTNWRNWLAKKPLTVIYAVAEPIEIDISEYLTEDNLIEVQGGGTITAVNEYNLAAPSTIQFIKKVGA